MMILKIAADLFHLLALIILIAKIWYYSSCKGVSGKSQIIFGLAYALKFSGSLAKGTSDYTIAMNTVFFLAINLTYIRMFRHKFTYRLFRDTCLTELVFIPAYIFTIYPGPPFNTLELIRRFTNILESLAIVPQLFMIYKIKQIQKLVVFYLAALGLYRAISLANWTWSYFNDDYVDYTSSSASVIYWIVFLIALFMFVCRGVKITDEKYEGDFDFFGFLENNVKAPCNNVLDSYKVDIEKNNNEGVEKLSNKPEV